MERLLDRIEKIVETLCALLMIALTLETLYVVVMRYCFNNTPSWGEIISRFLMVYACMFGFSIGIHEDSHVRIQALDRFLSPRLRWGLDIFQLICMGIVSVFLIVEGVEYTLLCSRNLISGLNIPSSYEMVCIPIGGVFCLLQCIRRGLRLRRKA